MTILERREQVRIMLEQGIRPYQIARRLHIDRDAVYRDIHAIKGHVDEHPNRRATRVLAELGRSIQALRGEVEGVREDLVSFHSYVLVMSCLDTAAGALRAAKQAQEVLQREARRR